MRKTRTVKIKVMRPTLRKMGWIRFHGENGVANDDACVPLPCSESKEFQKKYDFILFMYGVMRYLFVASFVT